jgi:O-methyltransferase
MNTKNPEFIKRMVVDSNNLSEIRTKFLNGDKLTDDVIQQTIDTTPQHPDINWGGTGFSLLPWTAIEHLDFAIRDTISRNVEGDFLETGAWRGGACIVAKSIYNEIAPDKKVYVADSFEGLPKPTGEYPVDNGDTHYLSDFMKVSLEQVKENFNKFDLIDDNLIFVKGWFRDTMPKLNIDKLSILRLDGDMYESTIQVLDVMYSKLSSGGYCIIDDYHHQTCKVAIHDFRTKHNITEPIVKVDGHPLNEVHYWIKK